MDEILRVTLLFDFYCELLTDKQRLVYEMYHLNDFSLQEISEELGVTRQGVRDVIVRTEKLLAHYEQKLGLLEKHISQKQTYEAVLADIDHLIGISGIPDDATETLATLKDRITFLLSE